MCSFICIRFLMTLLLTWIFVSTTSTTTAAATSMTELNVIDLFSKEFNNQRQLEEDEKYGRPGHMSVQGYFIPVKVGALNSNNTVLHLEWADNQLRRQEIHLITENPDGIIKILRYNITNTDKFRVDSMDSIDFRALQNLTPEDLEERTECEATFSEIEPNVFFGQYPACMEERNGIIPHLHGIITCNAFSGFTWPGAFAQYSTVPYIMRPQKSFPKLPEMLAGVTNYTSPC